MRPGVLTDYFTGVAVKRLSAAEAHPERSNQHEFNGVGDLRRILGDDRRQFPAHLMWLEDEEDETLSADGQVTWYDARERHATRTEYRLYFPTSTVSERFSEAALLLVGRRPDGTLLVAVAKAGSTVANQVLWLFGLAEPLQGQFEVRELEGQTGIELGFAARRVLEYLEIEVEEHDEGFLDAMLRRFGGGFPVTSLFSHFARETLPDVSGQIDPDAALVQWMEREELLFRTLERHIVSQRLQQGFGDDVDEFVRYSLAVQNRRKARAGRAFENHLEYLLHINDVRFSRGQVTENQARPDFLFPGIEEYRDPAFPADLLLMLGVKSSCKERWRQVLAEAARIRNKHLLTMEPGISENQTHEMRTNLLQLVVPSSLHSTYSAVQRAWLMNVAGFISLAKSRQDAA